MYNPTTHKPSKKNLFDLMELERSFKINLNYNDKAQRTNGGICIKCSVPELKFPSIFFTLLS